MAAIKQGRNQGGICRCEGCGERFSGMTAFDMHRTGAFSEGKRKQRSTRRCLNVAEMVERGMRVNGRRAWTTGREFDAGLWIQAS